MKAIELRGVTLSLGARAVLSDVTLAIEAGEFIGVLCPNGAGKTTLMRAILVLVPPTRGAIEVLGRPAERGNAAIGYLPQMHGLLESARLRGWDFVAAGQGVGRQSVQGAPGIWADDTINGQMLVGLAGAEGSVGFGTEITVFGKAGTGFVVEAPLQVSHTIPS